MTLITILPGVIFTDPTLSILYKDANINAGTLFAYDIDSSSYIPQINPVNSGVWNDLTYNNNNASFSIATPNSVAFSNGFAFNPVATNNYLTLPSSGKATANQDGFLYILWIKPTGASVNAYSSIAGCAQGTGNIQWSIDNGAANSGYYRILGPGGVGIYTFLPAINSINQIAIAVKLNNSTGFYQVTVYANGLQIYTGTTALTAIPQPSATSPIVGWVSGFTVGAQFTLYRLLGYNTSVFADMAAITTQVAADYAANSGRFS